MLIPLGFLGGLPSETEALELISSTVLTSAASTIEVTSIPTDYTHLMIQLYYIGGSGNVTLKSNFNSDTSAIYNTQVMRAGGTTLAGTTGDYNATGFIFDQLATTSLGYDWLGFIPNYQDSHYKQVIAHYGDASYAFEATGWYESTNAITSISFQSTTAATMGVNTRLSIWGII